MYVYLFSGVTVVLATVGAFIYFSRITKQFLTELHNIQSQLLTTLANATKLELETKDLKVANAKLDSVISKLNAELISLQMSDKAVKNQRDRLLEEIAKSGNPQALADVINAELKTLQDTK